MRLEVAAGMDLEDTMSSMWRGVPGASTPRSVHPPVLPMSQVAKNIVLAGVGSVTLVDDTPCAQRDPGNFLVLADADGSQT